MTSPQRANDTGAQIEIEQAVLRAGLTKDPLAAVLRALGGAIGELHAMAEHARQPDDERTRRAMVAEVAQAAAKGADRRAAELARARNWRTVVQAAAVLAGGIAAGAAGGYLAGQRSQVATEAGLTAEAFRGGPGAAAAWLGLMRANDVRLMLEACEGRAVMVSAGRRACGVGMWLDPPRNAAPAVTAR